MFQFAAPYGLKNAVDIFAKINFDEIKYSFFSVKKNVVFALILLN